MSASENKIQQDIVRHLRCIGAWVFAVLNVLDAIHGAGCVAGRVESVEDAARLMEE